MIDRNRSWGKSKNVEYRFRKYFKWCRDYTKYRLSYENKIRVKLKYVVDAYIKI